MALKSYFVSEESSNSWFLRLSQQFNDPLTEVYLLFFQSVLPVFSRANLFLQMEQPLIHCLRQELFNLIKKILSKFIKPTLISSLKDPSELKSLDIDLDNQVADNSLVIGFLTKQRIKKLLEEGDISSKQHDSFFSFTRTFFRIAYLYLLKWCPFKEELLIHVEWVDFTKRLQCTFSSVEYIVCRYSTLFENVDMDKLNDEFLSYQTMGDNDIPLDVRDSVGLTSEGYPRVDLIWNFLREKRLPGSITREFGILSKVANAVLTIPHSNAGEERIFSLINKNKTPSRASLDITGTLSSIITVKTHIDDPLQWQPSQKILEKAKKATYEYNKKHSSK